MDARKVSGTKRKAQSANEKDKKGPASDSAFSDKTNETEVSKNVHMGRVQTLKHTASDRHGPVIYWMSRDQRVRDNWALLYAVQKAKENEVPVAVVFNLVDSFLGAKARHFGFMLRGLKIVDEKLTKLNIPFFVFQGKPEETIPSFALKCKASLVVSDFSPLRIGKKWREAISGALEDGIGYHEVDAHSTVPIWIASDKHFCSLLPDYLREFPQLEPNNVQWIGELPAATDWENLIEEVTM